MSKQINFYMDKKTEEYFLCFLVDNDYIAFDRYGKQIDILKDKETFIFITQACFVPYLKYKNENIDILSSLAIELTKSHVDEKKQRVKRGRLYLSDFYKEVRNVEHLNDFIKEYNVLHNWIKKHVPYQNYINAGVKLKGYINDEMLDYSEKGYQFL